MSDAEAERFLRFMKFANLQDLDGYQALLADAGCEVLVAKDTGRFAPCMDLYLNMVGMQFTSDVLRLIGNDMAQIQGMAGEMNFIRDLAHAGKVGPGAVRRAKAGVIERFCSMAKCCGTKGDGWFGDMLDHCLSYATAAKAAGRPMIGILCEYTPRELILAAGGVPVCLCGGSAKTIPAAEEHLPANLCPLIKSTYGFHLQRSNPFLEMADLVVGETTCDGKKDVRTDGRVAADVHPRTATETRRRRRPARIGSASWQKFRGFLAKVRCQVSDEDLRGPSLR